MPRLRVGGWPRRRSRPAERKRVAGLGPQDLRPQNGNLGAEICILGRYVCLRLVKNEERSVQSNQEFMILVRSHVGWGAHSRNPV